MTNFSKLLRYCTLAILLILSCTKEVGLVTEVEFEFVEQHTQEGFVNEGLSTTLTVIPEGELEGYTYSFSYEVIEGAGYLEDMEGNRLSSGERIAFSPFSASVLFVGEELGTNTVRMIATDNFGFTEELTVSYSLSNVPLLWTATSAFTQIALGESVGIVLNLGAEAESEITYEAAYTIVSGDGQISAITGNEFTLTTDFAPIEIGTYALNFIPSEAGTAQIDFDLRDANGQELTATVSFAVVENIEVVSIVLGEHDAISMVIGDMIECPVTFTPENASDQSITWESSDVAIVTVNTQGSLTAVAEGTAVVTATSISNPAATATINVTVTATPAVPVTSIVVSEDPNSTGTGTTRQLIATVLPINATNMSVTWSSSDDSVATVDANGLVSGISAGLVTITATSVSNPEISDSIDVNITGGGPSSANSITAFELPVQNLTTIDPQTHTITVNVDDGTNLNTAPGSLSISGGATIDPSPNDIQDFSSAVLYTVTAANGDEQVWTVNVTVSASSDKSITSFIIDEAAVSISGTDIDITLPTGTVVTALVPTITFTGASLSPNSGVAQNFTNPVGYTVTADDGSQIDYTATVTVTEPTESPANDITGFVMPGQIQASDINVVNHTVVAEVPFGTNVTVVPLVLTVSTDATIIPGPSDQQDFTSPINYTVTAEDGTDQDWEVTVIVENDPRSDANDITNFVFPGQESASINIADHTVAVEVPFGTELTAAPSTLTVSTNATVSPSQSNAQDFSIPVSYFVTAENETVQEWTVTVNVLEDMRSDANDIVAFVFPEESQASEITTANHTITIRVPFGTDLMVAPSSLNISPNATVSPDPTLPQDFSSPFEYIVIAENEVVQNWIINVIVGPGTSFNRQTGLYTAPPGADVQIEISTLAFESGSAEVDVHTGSGRSGSLLASLGYVYFVTQGNSVNRNATDTFTMPSSGEVYIYARQVGPDPTNLDFISVPGGNRATFFGSSDPIQ